MSAPDALARVLGPGGLTVLFQPIVQRRNGGFTLRSVESLVRGPKGTNLEPAEVLFDYVRRKREEIRMDRACVAAVCAETRALPQDLDVSINVHSATVARDERFVDYLLEQAASAGLGKERLTIEIVEHVSEWAGPGLAKGLDAVRGAGIRIALDDVGLRQSNLRMVVDCRPDYFKLDRYFVQGAHADGYRRAVLESVVTLARNVNAGVVAEGVEDEADLDTAASLGITLFQGFLFARAMPAGEVAAWARRASAGDRTEAA